MRVMAGQLLQDRILKTILILKKHSLKLHVTFV